MASTMDSWTSEPLGLKKKVSDLDLVYLELQNLKSGSIPKLSSDGHRLVSHSALNTSSSDISLSVNTNEENSPFIPESEKSDATVTSEKTPKTAPVS